MHMENQQQLPTILSKAINLKRQRNLNTTKTNFPTTRRIWMVDKVKKRGGIVSVKHSLYSSGTYCICKEMTRGI